MNTDKIIFLRNFLFRIFIAGLVLAVLIFVITWSVWDTWSSFLFGAFKIEEKELGKLLVNSFLNLRSFLLFIILAPAIALHMMVKKK